VDFFLFLLVNATLFIRPAEIIPALNAWPIYNYVILANLIVAAPALVKHLSENGLTRCPTTTCVLGVLAFIFLSHFSRFDLYSARMGAFEFSKVVAYFLLLVSTVNTPKRLFTLLGTIVVFTLAINTLSVLQYQGKIDIPSLAAFMQNDFDEETGEAFAMPRMRATGIFNDPNDLSMIIVVSMLILLGGMFYRRWGLPRFLLAAPIGFLGYALTLTQSRGGLLALLAGCGALMYCKYGAARAAMLGAAGTPVLLAGFSGRQSDFGGAISEGTGASRAELWSDGLQLFKDSPVFGIGHRMFQEEVGHVAHNSFLHTYVELGFFGGLMFLGVFAIAGWSLWNLRQVRYQVDHQGLQHFLIYGIAILAAYCVAMMSLSRCYVAPTYLIAGSAAAYERLTRPQTSLSPIVFNGKVVTTLGVTSIGFLGLVYFYIKILHR
jgi:O-antigen ligase